MRLSLHQTVIHWEKGSSDGRGGFSYGAASELSCRFEERQERFLVGDEEKVSRAVLYADTAVSVGDIIFNGALTDLDSSQTHTTVDAWPIRALDKTPGVDGASFLYKAYL